MLSIHKLSTVHKNNKFKLHVSLENSYISFDCYPHCVILDTSPPQFIDEIRYAVKSFYSILSGFVEWQTRVDDGWESVDPCDDLYDAYYVCALFRNGRHIPLPILENWDPNENRLQKLSIKLARSVKSLSYYK